MTTTQLRIQKVSKNFGAVPILRDVSLEVQEGDLICLLGPSGSGKSTLLRCISGLETVDQGAIYLADRTITLIPPHLRGIGMMFQQFALFPHRSVAENIAFGLKMRGDSPTKQRQRVDELLELVGLVGFGNRSIFELSGGEQQRVALARSLAPAPSVLLLDEPMGALDRTLRERLMREVREIVKALNVTTLYVTHDQEEAFTVADRIVLLNAGQIVQEDIPERIYAYPATRFVAHFFGLTNMIAVEHVTIEEKEGQAAQYRVETELEPLQVTTPQLPSAHLLLRPEGATLNTQSQTNILTGTLMQKTFRGGHHLVAVKYQNGITLEWDIVDTGLPSIGEPITLSIAPTAITFIGD